MRTKGNYLNNQTSAHVKAIDIKKIMTKWMLISLFAVGVLSTATNLLAADNLYEKNYKAQNESNLASLELNPETKMFVSNHKDKDNISMLESGFDLMGTSGFTAADVKADLALQHGRAIKADTVLVYSKYGNTKTAASKIQMIKEAAKKGDGEIDAKDLEADTTQYNYYASYWAKLPAPLLGVHVIKLVPKAQPDEEPVAKIKGLTILAVIKDSPAAKAGLARGDVLYKLADMELNKPEELSTLVRQFQGKNVAIVYERDGVKATTSAQVNQR